MRPSSRACAPRFQQRATEVCAPVRRQFLVAGLCATPPIPLPYTHTTHYHSLSKSRRLAQRHFSASSPSPNRLSLPGGGGSHPCRCSYSCGVPSFGPAARSLGCVCNPTRTSTRGLRSPPVAAAGGRTRPPGRGLSPLPTPGAAPLSCGRVWRGVDGECGTVAVLAYVKVRFLRAPQSAN